MASSWQESHVVDFVGGTAWGAQVGGDMVSSTPGTHLPLAPNTAESDDEANGYSYGAAATLPWGFKVTLGTATNNYQSFFWDLSGVNTGQYVRYDNNSGRRVWYWWWDGQ